MKNASAIYIFCSIAIGIIFSLGCLLFIKLLGVKFSYAVQDKGYQNKNVFFPMNRCLPLYLY